MKDNDFIKWVGLFNCVLPCLLLGAYAVTGNLGANPVEFLLRSAGTLALLFLLITLAVTPLRKLLGWQFLGRLRRMFGVTCFCYALTHFLIYLSLDQSFDLMGVAKDVLDRPFITVGFLALFFMVPLAATSTNGMVRRLGGKRWQKLHRRVYVIAILAITHYAWLVKADLLLPILYGSILALLLGFRVVDWLRRRSAARTAPQPAAAA